MTVAKQDLCIGILRETKNPPDRRVIFSPQTALKFTQKYPNTKLLIQSSKIRCFSDNEYTNLGLTVTDDLSKCNILLGVKEVHIPNLIDNKQYHFFSHTHKKQKYNRPLLQKFIAQNITMVDHECLTYPNGMRVVAFGRWAGIVGAYNGLIAIGKRLGTFNLKRAKDCFDMNEMLEEVKKVILPDNYKILITGMGRVAKGALETLSPLGLKNVKSSDFLEKEFNEPVFCQIDADEYVEHKNGSWISFPHFFNNPQEYSSIFKPYSKATDLWIPCHFWDQASPKFLQPDDYIEEDFRIRIIADVSCDIANPIPSTLRPSTIAEPFYGYNPKTKNEGDAFDNNNVTVMAVDNCPGELPRDASEDFGNIFLEEIIPSIFNGDQNGIIDRATICSEGKLTSKFKYLQDFLDGK
jgi:alanine dehydrogenase